MLLLGSEPNTEPLIIERYDIRQRRRRTIVKIRRPSREPAQNRTLDFTDIGTLPTDYRSTEVGDLVPTSRHVDLRCKIQ